MAFKRLFIGTFIDNTLFKPYWDELQLEFNKVLKGKWTEIENLHFTYKFLGNVDEEKIPEIKRYIYRSLKEIDSTIKIGGLGYFPLKGEPQVLFSKIHNSDKSIFSHFNNIENGLKKIGFKPESKKFFPHITLIRIKSLSSEFNEIFQEHKDLQFGLMKSFKINLIESTLTQNGPIYKIIE
jgi:2'-5' RNA ligase